MESKDAILIAKSIDRLTKAVKENTNASKSKEDAIWWLGDAVAGLVEFLSQRIQIVEQDCSCDDCQCETSKNVN